MEGHNNNADKPEPVDPVQREVPGRISKERQDAERKTHNTNVLGHFPRYCGSDGRRVRLYDPFAVERANKTPYILISQGIPYVKGVGTLGPEHVFVAERCGQPGSKLELVYSKLTGFNSYAAAKREYELAVEAAKERAVAAAVGREHELAVAADKERAVAKDRAIAKEREEATRVVNKVVAAEADFGEPIVLKAVRIIDDSDDDAAVRKRERQKNARMSTGGMKPREHVLAAAAIDSHARAERIRAMMMPKMPDPVRSARFGHVGGGYNRLAEEDDAKKRLRQKDDDDGEDKPVWDYDRPIPIAPAISDVQLAELEATRTLHKKMKILKDAMTGFVEVLQQLAKDE